MRLAYILATFRKLECNPTYSQQEESRSMALQWSTATVERKHVWAPGLFTLAIRSNEIQPFEPGQFLQLALQLGDEHVKRPYSVASPPGETIEFFIVMVEDGQLTPHLWKLEAGQKVDVSTRAAGGFTLSHCPKAKCLWLLATGTGIAPYIAMLRTPEPWDNYERIVFVHGVRQGSDLAYQPELCKHREKFGERFAYVPVVSREDVPGTLKGRITTCIKNGEIEKLAKLPLSADDACVMMCGNPDMLDETEALLGERGMRKHRTKVPGHIVVERYW